jgi:hypothetical protein
MNKLCLLNFWGRATRKGEKRCCGDYHRGSRRLALIIILALALSGCAGIPNPLGGGGIAGNSSITLTCPDGKSTVTYVSGSLLPQTNPIIASCSSGGVTSTASVTGIDLAALLSVAKAAGPLVAQPAPR